MPLARRAKILHTGRNQAVRIPRELEFECNEVLLRKCGGSIVMEPARSAGLLAVLSRLEPVEDDFPDIDSSFGDLQDVNL